jgi:DNA-binding NarL/FixJ family response regulator
LEGLSSIFEVNQFWKNFPKTKIIFSGLSEQIYAPNAIKAGVSGYVHKTEKLETLGLSIINQGKIIMNETVKKNLAWLQNKAKVNVCIENFQSRRGIALFKWR